MTAISFLTTQNSLNLQGEPQGNDLYLDEFGNIAIGLDNNAVSQLCRNAAQTKTGELKYSVNRGIPFDDSVFSGSPNINQFRYFLRIIFMTITGVQEVVSINVSFLAGQLTYYAKIRTIYGPQSFNDLITI
jgi:hypothetical protein